VRHMSAIFIHDTTITSISGKSSILFLSYLFIFFEAISFLSSPFIYKLWLGLHLIINEGNVTFLDTFQLIAVEATISLQCHHFLTSSEIMKWIIVINYCQNHWQKR
jgi:hypothetical protein